MPGAGSRVARAPFGGAAKIALAYQPVIFERLVDLDVLTLDEVSGGSPYGAATLSGADGSRMPSNNELAIARFQGGHVAKVTAQLKRGA